MAETRVTVIPGDGIGPDIMSATIRVLDALDGGLTYDYAIAGQTAFGELDLVEQFAAHALHRIASNFLDQSH